MPFQKNTDFIGKIIVDGTAEGTGFVVSTEFRLVATAHHVISSVNVSRLSFQLFDSEKILSVKRIVGTFPIDREDVALLELEEPFLDTIKAPNLISNAKPTSKFTITGYDKTKKLIARSSTGELAGFVKKPNGVGFYHVEADHAFKGMSGSPVIVPDKGIIGILIEVGKSNSSFSGQALVVPIDEICKLDSRIETLRTKYLKQLIQFLQKSLLPIIEWNEYIPLDAEIWDKPDLSGFPSFEDSVAKATVSLSKFIVLGQPGSGKTTTLRKLALTAAQDCLSDIEAPLPIYLDLWEWSTSEDFNLFLSKWIKYNPLYESLTKIADYEELLLSHHICFFLDGLDEMQNAENVIHLKRWIERHSVRVAISCRSDEFTSIRRFDLPIILLRPLNKQKIKDFVTKYLNKEDATQFLSKVLPKAWDFQANTGYLQNSLAQSPFFLLLLLVEYKETKDITSFTSPLQLFQQITKRLWKTDRVQKRLQAPELQKYQGVNEITKSLSRVAYECIDQQTIPREIALKSLVNDNLLEAVSVSGLLRVNVSSGQVRFLHPLFAEYFASCTLENASGDEMFHKLRSNKWAGVFVFLAGKDEILRQKLQTSLMFSVLGEEFLHFGKDLIDLSYSRGILWALGQIGDEYAIGFFINHIQDQIKRGETPLTAAFATIAAIAGRLEDGNEAKDAVLNWFESILNVDFEISLSLRGYTHTVKVLFRVIDAVADIGNERASEILLSSLQTVLHKTVGVFEKSILISFFAISLSRIDAIKPLLSALQDRDLDVVNTVYQALELMHRNEPLQEITDNLEMHPSPTMRKNSAFLLGKTKDIESIDVLINALDDKGIWGYGTGKTFLGTKPRYFYVADMAAYALSQIGTDEAIQAILSKGYEIDGSISVHELITRIKSLVEEDDDNALAEWWATLILANPTPESLWELFECMGHTRVGFNYVDMSLLSYRGVGFQRDDPVLAALTQDYVPIFRGVAEYLFQSERPDMHFQLGAQLNGSDQSYIDAFIASLMPDVVAKGNPFVRVSKREAIEDILHSAEKGEDNNLYGVRLKDVQLLQQLKESIRVLNDLDAQVDRQTETIIAQLRKYVEQASDVESRKWALVALGRLGDTDTITLLTRFLSEDTDIALRSAAFYGLGILGTRHSKNYPNIEELVNTFLHHLDSIDVEAWSGFGIGIAKIAVHYYELKPELTSLILTQLIEQVNNASGNAARVALDALESVFFGLANFFEVDIQNPSKPTNRLPFSFAEELIEIISASPSYWMKVGNFILAQNRGDGENENTPDLEIIDFFRKATFFKGDLCPGWATNYTEDDWLKLCCADEIAIFQIAETLLENQQWNGAYQLFSEIVEDALESSRLRNNDVRLHRVHLMSLFRLCQLSLRLSSDMPTVLKHITISEQLAIAIDEKRLLLEILLISQQMFRKMGVYGDVLRVCKETISLAQELNSPDIGTSFLNMAIACKEVGRVEEALHYFDLAESKIKKYTEASQWTSLKLQQLEVKRQLGMTQKANEAEIIDTAKTIYELRSDWAGIALVLRDAGSSLYHDTNPLKALELYKEALTYIDRARILKIPDQKAMLLHDIALLYEVHLQDFDKAQQNYKQALEILEQLDMPGPMSNVMVNFGGFLVGQGEKKTGINLILDGFSIQQQLGLPTEYTLDMLTRIGDPDKKWKLPSVTVYMLVRTTIHVLNHASDSLQGWLSELDKLLVKINASEWESEIEFVEAIREIVISIQVSQLLFNSSFSLTTIPSSHPYFSQIQEIIDSVEQPQKDEVLHNLPSLMEEAVDIVMGNPEKIEEFSEYITGIGLQAMLQGELSFGVALMGIREYLKGKTPENADDVLDESALHVLQTLVDRTEERRFNNISSDESQL